MKTHRLTLSLLMLTTTIPAAAFAQATPEIVGIELGQAGIARYTLEVASTGNTLSFEVPEAHSDDVLASLIVRDPAGGVVDLQTQTPGSVDGALAASPFEGGIPRTTEGLIAALIGEEVAVTTARGTVEGRVLSTGTAQSLEGEGLVERAIAMLLPASGVAAVVWKPGARVTFSAASAARLADAVEAAQVRAHDRHVGVTQVAGRARAPYRGADGVRVGGRGGAGHRGGAGGGAGAGPRYRAEPWGGGLGGTGRCDAANGKRRGGSGVDPGGAREFLRRKCRAPVGCGRGGAGTR